VSSRPIKILVVDDEPMIRNFLRTGLRYEGFEVAEAGDGSEALEMASTFRPDLVILDVMMPRLDGHEVARRLRGDPDLGILMLTARDEVSDRIQGLDLGADDYLVKPFDFDELLSRLRAILRRLRPTWGQNLEAGPVRLDLALHQAFLSGRPLELTAREFDLLKLFVQHPKQALSRQTILDRVWGGDFFGGENNVEVYVGYLRRKLGARARLIQTVRGVGYRFVP
jgi:two-component system response regulator MprA